MEKPSGFYYFKTKPIILPSKHDLWRGVADSLGFKTPERLRVACLPAGGAGMIFYFTIAKENATLTSRHFNISRKTFHKWLKRFKDSRYDINDLADQSKAPYHRRNWEVTLIQEERIKRLRKKYPYYGKKKLKVLYQREYGEEISTWKIERVIRRHKLYPDQKKAEKTARKRVRAREHPKKRITQLTKDRKPYFLLQLDTIVIYWNNLKRYILTAVDHATKLAWLRQAECTKTRAPGPPQTSSIALNTSLISPLKTFRQIMVLNLF